MWLFQKSGSNQTIWIKKSSSTGNIGSAPKNVEWNLKYYTSKWFIYLKLQKNFSILNIKSININLEITTKCFCDRIQALRISFSKFHKNNFVWLLRTYFLILVNIYRTRVILACTWHLVTQQWFHKPFLNNIKQSVTHFLILQYHIFITQFQISNDIFHAYVLSMWKMLYSCCMTPEKKNIYIVMFTSE